MHVIFGDARELLLTGKASYDVIASERSNPYRAGVASLFTKEFYDAVAARLGPDGIFVQWVQAYEVQMEALSAIYTTLGAVVPSVETWELQVGKDLAYVASRRPYEAFDEPFAVHALNTNRRRFLAWLGFMSKLERRCVDGLATIEPNVPWEEQILEGRATCYGRLNHPRATQARDDLAFFVANARVTR